jgi:hypothetical protein
MGSILRHFQTVRETPKTYTTKALVKATVWL